MILSLSLSEFTHALISSLTMILVSELGDRTFLITTLLATRQPKLPVFGAAFGALAVVSVLSVVIGRGLVSFLLPPKWMQIVGAIVFIVVGVGMLTGLKFSGDESSERLLSPASRDQLSTITDSTANSSQFFDAISQSSPPASPRITTPYLSPLRMSAMVFVGEWGDRSQLALIALAAQENFWGVILGAIIGHAVCSGVACLFGHLITRYFSLNTGKSTLSICYSYSVVNVMGASLFIAYGLITLLVEFEG